MTRAILHLLLLIMVHQEVVHCIALNCSSNNSCNCQNIVNRVTDDWIVFCSLPERIDLTVNLEYYIQSATVHCHDMDNWPREEIETFKIAGKKSAVKFDHCPLPEWPLSNMIEEVGNKTMKTLEISGLTSTMSKLTRRNFLKLPRIHELFLRSSGIVEFSEDALQNLSHLRLIHFSQNEISVLPRGIFKGLTKLETLNLKDNEMQRVDSLLFENLSKLVWLRLSDNQLKSLEPGTFNDLVNLMGLNIANNYLTTLPEDIFKPLKSLYSLHMNGNEFFSLPHRLLIGRSRLVTVEFSANRGNLSTLPDGFFSNLASLRYVYVSGNNFTDLPEDIFIRSRRVGFVDLSRNKLSKLQDKTFKNLKCINSIDLSYNELNNLPEGLFEDFACPSGLNLQNNAITSVSRNLLSNSIHWESVNFDANQISDIEPWSFSNFTNLLYVYLRQNKLTSLLENIFWGNFNLYQVDISENKLTDLPVKLFRDATNLRHLHLNANELKDLPEGIFEGLDNLFYLSLQHNTFTTLPDKVLAQATSLQTLRLEFNHMTEIHLDDLWRLPSIKFAKFSHNFITRIIPLSNLSRMLRIDNIPDLTDLVLDHNKITDFHLPHMYLFEKLSLLNLTCNRITSLKLATLGLITNTVTIDVTRNNITKLAIDYIPSDSRALLHIGDNPIDCGCDVYQLRKHFVEKSRRGFNKKYIIMADDLTCSEPKSMAGKPVGDLELDTFECELDDSKKPRICLEECDCTWRPFDDTLVANCSYRNLTIAPYDFYGFKGIAIELNVTGNSITEMAFFHKNSARRYKYEKVRKIFLSRNRIRNVTFDVVPRNLRVLHLDNNNLTRFHVAVAENVRNTTSLQNLTLHSNPWSCDRETREAFEILKKKLDRKIGDAFGKSCLDARSEKNGSEKPKSYITYQMF